MAKRDKNILSNDGCGVAIRNGTMISPAVTTRPTQNFLGVVILAKAAMANSAGENLQANERPISKPATPHRFFDAIKSDKSIKASGAGSFTPTVPNSRHEISHVDIAAKQKRPAEARDQGEPLAIDEASSAEAISIINVHKMRVKR